ncbi:glycyl-tRNA synthetase beta chain [Maricaulis maris MCS10]|uniref:Glycine--tRNA ligase beta subunit n=1 Tax=Maricaulis maris (strain MCS10) TaxID=394221 RepID=Q0AML7_MARMM|nr:glycine--tRNA ligase subunit beta [Maricaulis maris]ABI66470.1 glycyl-tRNA synthetase beta chain [Maricaulis maris MCS10]
MSELLFEIFCEEIPARMQPRAEADLEKLLGDRLKAAGLAWTSLRTFAGARRLGLVIDGLPVKTADVSEERKGPRVGAPDKAVEGFLRGAGVASLDQCEKRADKKGEFWVARIEKPGRASAEVIAESIPDMMKAFPWPKSMKFGEGEKAQRWVRPIQRLLCVFDGNVVPVEVFGITASNVTEGHRRMGRGPFTVSNFLEYATVLEGEGHVLLDRAARESLILNGARKVCVDAGFELVEDAGLLTEVAGLVEWPVPVLGEMDPDFLDLPPEVITLTMKTHQKYFAVRDPKTGELVSKFVTIANQVAPDGGVAIAAGNARVLSARLSDARHFWDNDRKTPLSDMAAQLSKVTFHEKLGTVADKVERVAALAEELADVVGADKKLARRAAELAKADLVSEMVYEFPELQGAMGRYYALDQREDAAVADAIKDHYKPQGPSDEVPTAPVSAAVALADKLDTLVGFWAIDEKPTGSKDPFALRRAALGVIRILLEAGTRVPLLEQILEHVRVLALRDIRDALEVSREMGLVLGAKYAARWVPIEDVTIGALELGLENYSAPGARTRETSRLGADLLSFFADRLKVHLRDEGTRHDVIDAVFALGDDDLVRVTHKARALQAFLDTEDGAALLAGNKRASNILAKSEGDLTGEADAGYLAGAPESAERDLIAALNTAGPAAEKALADEDFAAAMRALSQLRAPIDAFFEQVTVNTDDAALRRNRLLLLSAIRTAIRAVADFDKISG